MVVCLLCEREVDLNMTRNYQKMEHDLLLCRECYNKIYPILISKRVLNEDGDLLKEKWEE